MITSYNKKIDINVMLFRYLFLICELAKSINQTLDSVAKGK